MTSRKLSASSRPNICKCNVMLFHEAKWYLGQAVRPSSMSKRMDSVDFYKSRRPRPDSTGPDMVKVDKETTPSTSTGTKAHHPCGNQQGRQLLQITRDTAAMHTAGPCGRRPVTWLSSGSQRGGLSEQWRYLSILWDTMRYYDHNITMILIWFQNIYD